MDDGIDSVEALVGMVVTSYTKEDDEILFCFALDDIQVKFHHEQDCCENVYIESVVGSLDDLVGAPLLMAEEVVSRGEGDGYESSTYTFYKFATIKGYVDIRWVGSSNGYYSERVDVTIEKWEP